MIRDEYERKMKDILSKALDLNSDDLYHYFSMDPDRIGATFGIDEDNQISICDDIFPFKIEDIKTIKYYKEEIDSEPIISIYCHNGCIVEVDFFDDSYSIIIEGKRYEGRLARFVVHGLYNHSIDMNSDFFIDRTTLLKYNGNERVVHIPEGITSIYSYAFHGKAVEEVVLPSSIVSIDDRAFLDCTKLNRVDLSTVLDIGSFAFGYCESLKEIEIPSTVKKLEADAFKYSGLASLEQIKNKSDVVISEKFFEWD